MEIQMDKPNELLETIKDLFEKVRDLLDRLASAFKKTFRPIIYWLSRASRENPKVSYLAQNHKKGRVRKKNMNRLIRWCIKAGGR